MNKKITKLMAAFALLTFLAVPMGMRGQTRADQTAKWTATSGDLGTGIGSGTITDNGNFSWSYTRTLISGSSYTGWTSNCIQLGKNGGVENLTLTTSAIPGTIKSVAVECASYSAKHKVSITVGGNTYLASTATSSWTTVGTATGTGTSSGTITIAFTEGSRALYIKSITVVYDNSGGPTTYSVTYNGNGNTDGTVPTDNNAYENGDNVTVLGNTGNLAKTGHTFGGWCLNAGGTGTVYGPGSGQTATYAISANTIFYAKWTLNTHNITMPASDTYGSYSASATSNVPYGTTVTLTFAPAAGYESYIATWSVNGEAISGDIFTMPDEDVTVGVTLNNYLKDELNYSFTGVSSGGYTNWNNRTGISEAVYAGRTAGSSSQNYLQLNYSTSSSAGAYHSGIITTGSGGKVKKVVVTWATNGGTMPDARVLNVYGSNTAYSETADLYDSDTQGDLLGSIAKGTGTTLNIAGDYKYVGILPDGAAYFTKIEVYWEPSTEPTITVSPDNITDFGYTIGSGPSVKSFTVGGSNLGDTDISIELETGVNFEMALAENAETWNTSVSLTPINGTISNTPIYVRMKSGLEVGNYTDNVSATWGNLSETISLSGTVSPLPVTYTYTAATSVMHGKRYIIVGFDEDSQYALGEQKSSNRGNVDVTSYYNYDDDVFSIPDNVGVYEFVISGNGISDYYFTFYDLKNSKYLCASSSSSNELKTQATNDANGQWTITFTQNEEATITAQGSYSRKLMRFNPNNGNPIFACYATNSSTGSLPFLYERTDNNCDIYSATNIDSDMTIAGDMNIHAGVVTVKEDAVLTVNGSLTNTNPANLIIADGGQLVTNSAVNATLEKEIVAAENWGQGEYTADNWYFIASPVNGAAFPTGTVDDQDIYQLDWASNKWLNLQISANGSLLLGGFTRGTGYLYASKDGKTISVAGEIQALSSDDDATVTLATTGWNLIGNPLTCKVTVDHSFGLLNNGSAIDYTGTTVNPFQGIVVWGNANDVVTFTKAATQNAAAPGNSSLQMTVAQNVVTRGNTTSTTIDNAVVSFNESSILPKFNMLEGNAKLYIPQGTEEYAIVSTEAQGEMPVSFKANENGTYTLTVKPEGVEMNYLHLIDNMTGMDVDLLQTPSYTFNAKTTDYESRFRLVFAANNSTIDNSEEASFAFFSNGSWIISNEGEATLQVIDLNGRILSSETINGSVSTNINATTGIYMMRLINGDNVKTQKVVVR